MRCLCTSFFPCSIKDPTVTSTTLELWSPSMHRGHLATDVTTAAGRCRTAQEATSAAVALLTTSAELEAGAALLPGWRQQWKTSQDSPDEASGDLSATPQNCCREGRNSRSQCLWGICTHTSLFLVEQLQHSVPFQEPLLHPAWQSMLGHQGPISVTLAWRNRAPFPRGICIEMVWSWRGQILESEEGSFLTVTVLGGWRAELCNGVLARPLGYPSPSPLSPVICCSALAHHASRTWPTPRLLPQLVPMTFQEWERFSWLFNGYPLQNGLGRGDWSIRGHYCLNTFVLPFFSETLNYELPYTECPNWQL